MEAAAKHILYVFAGACKTNSVFVDNKVYFYLGLYHDTAPLKTLT